MRVKPDGFRRVSIETDPEFAYAIPFRVGTENSNIMSPSNTMADRPRFTAEEEEKEAIQQEDDISMRGMTPSPSKELLPKTRKIPKQNFSITRSVIQSKHETARPPVDFLNKNEIPPSIKKHLRERANFYRRKLTFYENLGVLAVSLTSDELGSKIKEARQDL